MPDLDALYHRLFSHPGMVAQLLHDFVHEPWVADLDLDRMERSNARYHADDDQRRESDVVWRIPLHSGGEAYLLLMLEFQSTPDRWMALRVLVYAGLLWQQIIAEKRLTAGGKLPPIYPLVIYNGDLPWTISLSLSELIDLPPGSKLWQSQPKICYNILDEGGFTDADLAKRDTLAALLFRLENARLSDEAVVLVDAVIAWFRRHDGFETLRPIFAALANRVIALGDGAAPAVKVSENLLEARTMLATRAAEWKAQARQEGLQEGLQQGLQEGLQQGRLQGQQEAEQKTKVNILLSLLERRFASVPDTTKTRIQTAAAADLDNWIVRVLDATTIDDLIAGR